MFFIKVSFSGVNDFRLVTILVKRSLSKASPKVKSTLIKSSKTARRQNLERSWLVIIYLLRKHHLEMKPASLKHKNSKHGGRRALRAALKLKKCLLHFDLVTFLLRWTFKNTPYFNISLSSRSKLGDLFQQWSRLHCFAKV